MKDKSAQTIRDTSIVTLSLLSWQLCSLPAEANPTGGTVASGQASFNSSGSHFTVNTSANTVINWQSFNVGVGETTTFVQPSSSSVVWNQINDANPSQILGTINANGYVVLQNQSGFVVGGSAVINAHGLIMSTASSPPPSLSGGGAWSFSAPPPMAKIINYGQINITGGGSAFLIANDIENNGTISADNGKIGLYAGETVLASLSPDGRGLSAQITLPQGSVDNEGRLIANAGSIAIQSKMVNQNGLIQADSVRNVNGTIELVASDNVSLGASSVISAQGGSQGNSSGGDVTIKSANTFSDQAGSVIDIAGGAQGGNGGQVEISAPQTESLQTSINGQASAGFTGGILSLDPLNIKLVSTGANVASSSGTVGASDPPTDDTLSLNVNLFSSTLSQINLQAINDIELSTTWSLANSTVPASLTLTAGNNIILDNASSIKAGNNWSVNLSAGPATMNSAPVDGTDGIYLLGNSFIQTQNGNINLFAANQLVVNWNDDTPNNGTPIYVTQINGNQVDALSSGAVGTTTTGNGIRTQAGGNINVVALTGDVFTGGNTLGYIFGRKNVAAPYYQVSPNVGGISTVLGGNVNIDAGGDVVSYLPRQSDLLNAVNDPGSGAFGAGSVTVNAGGNVYGNFVMANGTGKITAGGDIGESFSDLNYNPDHGFAISLAKGGWSVSAPEGSIYITDVSNPNGVFGETKTSSPDNYVGYHVFNYDPTASVLFSAGDSVEINGTDAPNTPQSGLGTIPLIFPPQVTMDAGAGGVILDTSVILYPSQYQSLSINTVDGGNFGIANSASPYTTLPVNLEMSDSAANQWTSSDSFGTADQASTLPNLLNTSPVNISISGSMNDINLYTTKATQITVGGDMINCGFNGMNRSSGDISSIKVTGNLFNSPYYTFAQLTAGIISANPLQPSVWDSVFDLALNPDQLAALANLNVTTIPGGLASLTTYLKQNNYLLFPSDTSATSQYGVNPGFVYDANAGLLAFQGVMNLTGSQIAALEGGTFTVLVADAQGNPLIVNGHLQTTTYNFSAGAAVSTLVAENSTAISFGATPIGYELGGPGQFDVSANSISLGNTPGISSVGFANNPALASLLPVAAEGGASVCVTTAGDINMITSSVFSEDGGDVNVNAGGQINLSEGTGGNYFDFQTTACYGIYTSGHSDVNVIADGDINIGNARIATFNGGNLFAESLNGDVNAGNGANIAVSVFGVILDPITGLPSSVQFGDYTDANTLRNNPPPYGSGILAEMMTPRYQSGGINQPGNILVETPHGNIVSGQGGIQQFALDASILGPSVTLTAGIPGATSPADPDQGNILLGQGGVVGGAVNVTATGKIQGFFVSQQDLNVAGQTFTGFGLAGQTANVSANEASGGPVVIVGIGAVNASGLGSSATLLSQNVSANGASGQSTLGTSVNASAASQSAAAVTSNDSQKDVATTDDGTDDLKKKKGQQLMQKIKRVTVILPKT